MPDYYSDQETCLTVRIRMSKVYFCKSANQSGFFGKTFGTVITMCPVFWLSIQRKNGLQLKCWTESDLLLTSNSAVGFCYYM